MIYVYLLYIIIYIYIHRHRHTIHIDTIYIYTYIYIYIYCIYIHIYIYIYCIYIYTIYIYIYSIMNTNGNYSASWHLWWINAGATMPRQVGWVMDLPFDVSEPHTATNFFLGWWNWYHEHFLAWPCQALFPWEIVYLLTILASDGQSAFVRTQCSRPQHSVTAAKVAEEGIKAERLIVFPSTSCLICGIHYPPNGVDTCSTL